MERDWEKNNTVTWQQPNKPTHLESQEEQIQDVYAKPEQLVKSGGSQFLTASFKKFQFSLQKKSLKFKPNSLPYCGGNYSKEMYSCYT